MADSDNINNPLSIIDAVNNPVVSNSDTPQVLFALQLTRSGRPWVLGKTVDLRYHPVVIDLKMHSELWEDFYDAAVARERQSEPRETLEAVKKRLRRRGKLRVNG